jgi:hypothetical protein
MPVNKAGRCRMAVRSVFVFSTCITISFDLCQIMTIIYACQPFLKIKKPLSCSWIVASLEKSRVREPLSGERNNDDNANADTNIHNGYDADCGIYFAIRVSHFH